MHSLRPTQDDDCPNPLPPHSYGMTFLHSLLALRSSLPRVLLKQAPENEFDTLRKDGDWEESPVLITVDYEEPVEITPWENSSLVLENGKERKGGRKKKGKKEVGREGRKIIFFNPWSKESKRFLLRGDGWTEWKGKQKEVRRLMKNSPAIRALAEGLRNSHSGHCSATDLLSYKCHLFSGSWFSHLCNGSVTELRAATKVPACSIATGERQTCSQN